MKFLKVGVVILSLLILAACGGGGGAAGSEPAPFETVPPPLPPSPPPIDVTPVVPTIPCNNTTVHWELDNVQTLDFGTIYVGMVPLAVDEWVAIYSVDPYVLSYHLPADTLPGGLHYIVMTVSNENGESGFSNEVERECGYE